MKGEIITWDAPNYLENPIILNYFEIEEKRAYYHSLKLANDKRDLQTEMISCLSSFIEVFKDEKKICILKNHIFKKINTPTLKACENILNQAKHINREGFELMKINEPLNFNTLKKYYKEAAKIHHPDKGGETSKMQILNNAFSQFHKLIEYTINPKEAYIGTKSVKEYLYFVYNDIIYMLVDSWDIDNAYRFLKEAIDNGIFIEPHSNIQKLNNVSFLCTAVCERLPNIGLTNKGYELLTYIESSYKKFEGYQKDHSIKRLKIYRDILENNKKYRVIINHKIQADNAKRLGIITENSYAEYIKKLCKAKKEKEERYRLNENILSKKSFIVPLVYEKKIYENISKPRINKLIPQPEYFQFRLEDISKEQQWEYFKAFSDCSDIDLIKKYVFVRLYSFMNSIVGHYSTNLCNAIIDEITLLKSLFKDSKSIQGYSNKILEGLNIFLSIDNDELERRLELIRRYCTINTSMLDTPIIDDFLDFMKIETDKMQNVLNSNKSFCQLKRIDMIERRKLDKEILNSLREYEEKAGHALYKLKKKDIEKAQQYIETYVDKVLDVIQRLHCPEWIELSYWLEELCKINTRLGYEKKSKLYIKRFFELPENRRGRTNAGRIKKLKNRLSKLVDIDTKSR